MDFSILSAALWSFFFAATTGAALTGMLLALRMSNFQIGLVNSMTVLFLPFQVLGALLQQRYFHRKRFWFASALLYYLSFFAIVALLLCWNGIPSALAATLFLAVFAVGQLAVQLAASVFLAWMGELVPQRESNSFWNRRQGWVMITIMVGSVAVGVLIDALGRGNRLTYAWVVGVGALFGLLSMWAQTCAPDPATLKPARRPLLAQARKAWRDRDFRRLLWFFGFQSLVAWLAAPFIFVYLQKDMGLPMMTTQILVAASCLVSFFSGYLFRVVGNRYGRKPLLMLCSFLKGGEFLLWGTLLPGTGWLGALPCFLMGGFVNMGIGSSQLSLLTSLGGKRDQSFMIGVFFAVNGLCAFASASVSGIVYDWVGARVPLGTLPFTAFNLLCLFVALGYVASLLFFIRFRENGAAPTAQVVRVLLSNNPFRSVYHAHALSHPMSEQTRIETLDRASGNLVCAELLHDLYSPSSRVRESALGSIARNKWKNDPALEEELIKFTDLPEFGFQAMAARALGHLGATRAVGTLLKHLESGNVTLAQSCAFALGLLGDRSVIPALEALINNERHHHLWAVAAEALGKLGDHRQVRRVHRAFAAELNETLKIQCLIALSRLMAADKTVVHPAFEAEERQPGGEIERLLKLHFNRAPADLDAALSDYDAGRHAQVLGRILALELDRRGLLQAPPADLSSLFVSAGVLRPQELNADTPDATALWLALNLWAELKYSPSRLDRYVLLTALLALTASRR